VALLVPLLEQWYIKTEALSFLYDYDVMVIISINFRTGNTVSLLTFFIGENIHTHLQHLLKALHQIQPMQMLSLEQSALHVAD